MLINFILISLAFLLFAYFVFQIIVKRDYKNHLKLSPTSYLLEIIVFALHANLFYFTIPTTWPHFPSLPENTELRLISAIILGIGIIILLFSWFDLGTETSLGMDKDKLKTTGTYKYSRNPQLIGYGLVLTSFVVVLFSWLAIIWILLYVVAAFFMIRSEEEFLENKYDEEYSSYCEKVPRLFRFKRR